MTKQNKFIKFWINSSFLIRFFLFYFKFSIISSSTHIDNSTLSFRTKKKKLINFQFRIRNDLLVNPFNSNDNWTAIIEWFSKNEKIHLKERDI